MRRWWSYRSSWFKGYQCNLGCRYEVFTNFADARRHLQDVHNQTPEPDAAPPVGGPFVWVGLAAITCGLLIVVLLCLAYR